MKWHFRDVAPLWDSYDTAFTTVLLVLITIGYVTFVETISLTGLFAAWTNFIENSGLLALLAAWTAVIGLYRLRHRPGKVRPSVREDFKNPNGKETTEFGLRNFGPGPALYIQVVATIEQNHEPDQVEVARVEPHDPPIHLREDDFVSLLPDTEDGWVNEVAEEYNLSQSEGDDGEQQPPPRINLYYAYVSQSGTRTPNHISSKRDDSDVLDEIKNPETDARRIELSRVVNAC
jgi:hypothetical protein